uniref:Uncharacterized protein n=1 Tax=Leersia perrieri TaxID=77586 RepID=A0A0D9VIT2_9ORYZ
MAMSSGFSGSDPSYTFRSSSVTSPSCTGGGSGCDALSSTSRLLGGGGGRLRRPDTVTYSAATTATAVKNAEGDSPVYAAIADSAAPRHSGASAIAFDGSATTVEPQPGKEEQREEEEAVGLPLPAACVTVVATVVTGGNRGVGLEICKQLASNGILVVLTARDEGKGSQAVKALEQSGLSGVIFHQLDVIDPSSIMLLVEFVRTKFGKLDILIVCNQSLQVSSVLLKIWVPQVNNAAIGGTTIDPEILCELLKQDPKASFVNSYMGSLQQNYEMAKECLEINFYGTKGVTDSLMPLLLLSNSGKVINLSSKISQLQFISNEGVIKVLSDIDNLSDEKLKDVSSIFLTDFKDGNLQAHGWQPVVSAYAVSKTLVNAYSRLLAKKHPSLEVYCVNPGFVKTDLNYGMGLISAEEGAKAPVRLALQEVRGNSCLYFEQLQVLL